MIDTPGRAALSAHCDAIGGQSEAARQITAAGAPITQSAVSQWVRGATRPEPLMREVLARVLSIPVDAWTTADERATIDRVDAIAADRAS